MRRDLIRELSSHLLLEEEPVTASTGKFEGMTFCITGTLSQPRKAIQLMVKSVGGKVVSSISKKLDVLIAGQNAGSKLAKAERLGVKVWDENKLSEALNGEKPLDETSNSSPSPERNRPQSSLLDF